MDGKDTAPRSPTCRPRGPAVFALRDPGPLALLRLGRPDGRTDGRTMGWGPRYPEGRARLPNAGDGAGADWLPWALSPADPRLWSSDAALGGREPGARETHGASRPDLATPPPAVPEPHRGAAARLWTLRVLGTRSGSPTPGVCVSTCVFLPPISDRKPRCAVSETHLGLLR